MYRFIVSFVILFSIFSCLECTEEKISGLKKAKYAFSRLFFKTIGRTSKGVRLCLDEGLTSGKTLDYIYENNPQGDLLIGKSIDSAFLNHEGWEAVRCRRKHLEYLLTTAVNDLRGQDRLISIVDIASGPASYIISVLERVGEKDVFVCCRDLDSRWLQEGKNKAKRKNITHISFEKGDAFDRNSLLNLYPKPNIIVSSGFYDWINEDQKVKESLGLVFESLEKGGYFILTIQTEHPNLEFVQEVFSDFNHDPLQMTMRSEETIKGWLEEAGFKVETTLKDSKGYYSVFKTVKESP